MSDITLKAGPMSVNTDPNKVNTKYAQNAPAQMKKAAENAIVANADLKALRSKTPREYTFSATLSVVEFGTHSGQPSVTCKLMGVLSTPNKFRTDGKDDVVSGSITGSATLVGGTTDRDVADCIAEAVKATINKSVMTGIKDHLSKNP